MNSAYTIVSWCPGDPCDPCKPKPVDYDVAVVGSYFNNVPTPPNPTAIYIEWTWNGIDPYPIDGTVLLAVVTITVTGENAAGVPQRASIQINGSSDPFFGFPVTAYFPLPSTPLGIRVTPDTAQITQTAIGDLIPKSGGARMILS